MRVPPADPASRTFSPNCPAARTGHGWSTASTPTPPAASSSRCAGLPWSPPRRCSSPGPSARPTGPWSKAICKARRGGLRAAAPGDRPHRVADGRRSGLRSIGHYGLAGARNRRWADMAGTSARGPAARTRSACIARRSARRSRETSDTARAAEGCTCSRGRSICRWTRRSMPPRRHRCTCWQRWSDAGFATSKDHEATRRCYPVAQDPVAVIR